MKIVIEFESVPEHDAYIRSRAREFIQTEGEQRIVIPEEETFHLNQPDTTIETGTRRRYWTDMEIQFIKDYYITKKTRWIAKALNRKMADVSNKLTQLYKKGLPRKHSKNGKIRDN